MVTKNSESQPSAWEVKKDSGAGVLGSRRAFLGSQEGLGIEEVPTTWLRLSDVKGMSERQLFQLLPEVGQLGRARLFACCKASPASGISWKGQ